MANKNQIEELKETLLYRKDTILNNVRKSRDSIDELKNQDINDEFDYADFVSDSFTEGMIANHQIDELNQIEDALRKINAGTYGICDMCGINIPIGRLKAKPFAKFCTECRTVFEQEQLKKGLN